MPILISWLEGRGQAQGHTRNQKEGKKNHSKNWGSSPLSCHPRGGAAEFGKSSGNVSRRSWDEKQGGWCLLMLLNGDVPSVMWLLKSLRLWRMKGTNHGWFQVFQVFESMILSQISAPQNPSSIKLHDPCGSFSVVSIIWIFILIFEMMIQTWLILFNRVVQPSWCRCCQCFLCHPSLCVMVEGRGPYPSAEVNVWRSSNVWRTRWLLQLGAQHNVVARGMSHPNLVTWSDEVAWERNFYVGVLFDPATVTTYDF